MTAAIQNGTRLKHYRIIGTLGQGGMGTVYRALDERLEREVAVKVISDDRLNSEIAHKRFRREATSLSKLIHPNVAAVFDYDQDAGHEFLVMELVEGEPLDKILARGPMSVEDVLTVARQLLSALAAAHAISIIHRDLKPANLMLTPAKHLKVLDFGLAKAFAAAATDETSSLVTRDTVCGTVAYMSPEQLRGEPLDGRSDLFAASAVLYELLTGKRPFTGRTEPELIDAILNRAPQPIHSLRADVPTELERAIARGLAKEILQHASAEEMASALAKAALVKGRSGFKNLAISAASLILIAVAAALFWWLPERSAAPSPANSTQSAANASAAGMTFMLGGKPSPVAEANEDYKRALLLLLTQSNLPKARELLEKALQLDPKFAQARAWYGFSHLLMLDTGFSNDTEWIYRAERELRRALADDSNNARVHSGLAAVYFYEHRYDDLYQEAKKADALDPNEYDTGIWLGLYYQIRGEYDQSQSALHKILDRNEFFFPARMNVADNLRQMGQIDAGLTEAQKILDVDPRNVYGIQYIVLMHLSKGDAAAAHRVLDPALKDAELKANYQVRIPWALLLAYEGKKAEALKVMDKDLQQYLGVVPNQLVYGAEFYALLGDKKTALDWLEREVNIGDDRAEFFKRDPLLKNLRDEPKFQQIIESMEYRVSQRKSAHR